MSISYHEIGLVSSHQSVGRWFIFMWIVFTFVLFWRSFTFVAVHVWYAPEPD